MDGRLDELTRLELGHILRDCKAKLAPLDERRKEEFLLACKEGRQPHTIQPLTAIRSALLLQVMDGITEIPDVRAGVMSLKAIIRDQKQGCKHAGDTVALYSDHLAAILEAAGIKEEIVA